MSPRRLPHLLLAALLAVAAHAQPAPGWWETLHPAASVTASRVDNLSRTSAVATRKDADTFEAEATATVPRQLAPGWLLVGGADLRALTVSSFSLNNEWEAGGRLTLQRKLGLGPLAWVVQAGVAVSRREARAEDRNGWRTEANLEVAKRLAPNLRVAAGAQWLDQAARAAWADTRQHSLSLEARWDLDERWTLSGRAARLSGDIVANAAWPVWQQALSGGFGSAIQSYYSSRPWTQTHLYGPGWVSYNVEADVDLWSVALSCALTDRTALELRRSGAYVVNRVGVAYPTSAWSLGLSHRF